MFREMRRKDRALTPAETTAILKGGIYGVLSLNGRNVDEHAYGIPVGYVYEGNCLYIHCATSGEKLDRLRSNNKVSFCVVGPSRVLSEKFAMEYASVIAFGQVREVEAGEKLQALRAFLDKYSADFIAPGNVYIENAQAKTSVLRIDIEHMTGKARKA